MTARTLDDKPFLGTRTIKSVLKNKYVSCSSDKQTVGAATKPFLWSLESGMGSGYYIHPNDTSESMMILILGDPSKYSNVWMDKPEGNKCEWMIKETKDDKYLIYTLSTVIKSNVYLIMTTDSLVRGMVGPKDGSDPVDGQFMWKVFATSAKSN